MRLLHPLLHDWDASGSPCLMVYAKVSHHWHHGGFIFCEDVLEGPVDLFVGAYEGSLFGTHLHAKLCEPLVKVSVGLNGLLGDLLGCGACCVIANVVHPAGEMDVWMLFMPWCKGWCEDSFG